jgi:hypothetical protein
MLHLPRRPDSGSDTTRTRPTPLLWHARRGDRQARNRVGGQEREPDAGIGVSAAA